MSTLHLVEIDADENIIEELEVDDDVLQALEEDEDTELSLSDDDNEVYLVELDDDGDIVDAVAIGQDDDEDTELSLSDRVDGLELSIASMLGKGARAIAGKARSGFGAVKSKIASFRKPDDSFGAGVFNRRERAGMALKSAGNAVAGKAKQFGASAKAAMKAAPGAVGRFAIKNKKAFGAGAAGAGGGFAINTFAGGNRKGKQLSLSLSADQLLSPDYNPLLADVESRTAK